MGPTLLHTNAHLCVTQPTRGKLKELGYKVVPHLPYSPDLSPTDNHFFKHLNNILQGKCFHNQQDAGNAFQEFIESQSIDLYPTGIKKLLIGRNVLITMVLILINKDIFESSCLLLLLLLFSHQVVSNSS